MTTVAKGARDEVILSHTGKKKFSADSMKELRELISPDEASSYTVFDSRWGQFFNAESIFKTT